MRWPTDPRSLLVAAVAGGLAGCAWSDGEPWARATFDVRATLDLPDSRINDDGRWVTTTNQSVDLFAASATVRSAALTFAATGGDASFDPADPPAGYSNCHNGHCHADDGALVDYEDIALELGGVDAGATTTVIVAAVADLLADPSPLPMTPCDGGCTLERGDFATMSVTLDRLVVDGRVFDDTDDGRIDEGGVDVRIELVGPIVVDVPLDGAVTRDTPVEHAFDLTLTIPAQLLDGVDFGAVAITEGRLTDEAALITIAANLTEHATLDVTLDR